MVDNSIIDTVTKYIQQIPNDLDIKKA